MTWDDLFMDIARAYARKSKDPSTKVGAVIVGPRHEQRAGGFNGFPRGVREAGVAPGIAARWERPAKYLWCEHAERNAVYNAAATGAATNECTIYVWGPLPPCAGCARAIIQGGLLEVVVLDRAGHRRSGYERWIEEMDVSLVMLFEAGVRVREARLEDPTHLGLRHDGSGWVGT